MKQIIARDLLLLAAVAYRNNQFDKSGSLFAAALASDDADELLKELDVENILGEDSQDDWGSSLSSDAPRIGLSAISAQVADAMSHVALSSDDDEEVEMPLLADIEDEDAEDDAHSDDLSDEIPGTKVLPSSLSSSHQGGGGAKKVKLVLGHKGPVRVK